MVWVGDTSKGSHHDIPTSYSKSHDPQQAVGVWSPNSSIVNHELDVDFDLIVSNIKQLNILAGEGSSEVTRTPKGAQLKVRENETVEGMRGATRRGGHHFH